MREIGNAHNVKMDFTELSLEGADCINVRTPFLSNMATSDFEAAWWFLFRWWKISLKELFFSGIFNHFEILYKNQIGRRRHITDLNHTSKKT